MRQVRTCDFCGADATGVYESLPPDVDPNSPRLLLCDECRDRLASVVDPLLDRLDADAMTPSDEPNSGESVATDAGTDANPEPSPEPEPEQEAGGRPMNRREGTPRGYRKVMRFLENREFPIDREEAEQLAADAYGLDPETVSAAIDHAVKYDRLSDVGGELRR